MSDATTTEDEIDKLVDGVVKQQRNRNKKGATRVVPPDGDDAEATAAAAESIEPPLATTPPAKDVEQITMEQLEALQTIVPDLPKPVENVKTIGYLVGKYNIGQRADFKLQVYRQWPKIFPGGRKADGFLDDYDQPIDEAFIQNEYGGGEYLVKVVGPKSGTNQGYQHYESVRVNIQGDPKWARVSRAQQTVDAKDGGPSAPPVRVEENPRIVEIAMGTLKDALTSERDERRRVEQRSEVGLADARQLAAPLVEAELRRSEDVITLHRERAEAERKALEERAAVDRERAAERQTTLERALEEQRRQSDVLLRRMEEMENARREVENSRPSLGAEIRDIFSAMPKPEPPPPPPPPPRGELELAGKVLDQTSEKHRAEIEAMRGQHATLIDGLRAGHEREIAATREANAREIAAEREAQRHREQRHDEQVKMERGAHERELVSVREMAARELAAEREAWRHRELRYEDQIKQEREERRRDQERAREVQNERDQAAKDSRETMEMNLKTQWEARLAMVETNHGERVRWLQSEVDNKVREIGEVRSKLQDTHDPVVQMTRFREFRDAARDGLGLVENTSSSSSSSSGSASGIGLSGSNVDLNEMVQTVAERGPELLSALSTLVRGPGPGQQPQQGAMIPGQIVITPMGQMMVVQTPEGLRLQPLGEPPRLLPPGQPPAAPAAPVPGQQARRQAQQTAAEQHAQQGPPRRRKRGGSADFDPIPNLAEGLERPRAPWEQRQGPFAQKPQPAAQQAAPQQQQQVPAAVAAAPARPERVSMNAMEKQIALAVAKLVHDSVNQADTAEEFVEKVMEGGFPTAILEGICAKSDQEIIDGIKAVEPRSAGATPAGHRLIRDSMALLREAVAGGGGDE